MLIRPQAQAMRIQMRINRDPFLQERRRVPDENRSGIGVSLLAI